MMMTWNDLRLWINDLSDLNQPALIYDPVLVELSTITVNLEPTLRMIIDETYLVE